MVMTQTKIQDKNADKARQLLQQGYLAYNNWEVNKARLVWRRAVILDPGNEAIWLALLTVLTEDDDKRVCLQNILIINPDNKEAEKRLRLYEEETQPAETDANLLALESDQSAFDLESLGRILSYMMTISLILLAGLLLGAMLIQPLV